MSAVPQEMMMEQSESTEADLDSLLEQAKQGCQSAIAMLVERFSPRLYRCIRRTLTRSCRRTIDSDDVAQSVWKSIFAVHNNGYLNRIQSPTHFRGALARIAFNKTISKGRLDILQRRSVERLSSALVLQGRNSSVAETRIPTADEQLIAEETLERLIGSVPETHSHVIKQRIAGASAAEISGELGISLRSLHRILQNSRKQVDA